MKRDLKNMRNVPSNGKKNLNPNDYNDYVKNVPKDQLNDMQSAINHYSGKSDGDLMRDLKNMTSGVDSRQLKDVQQKLSPMLTPQQQQKLSQILSQLNK